MNCAHVIAGMALLSAIPARAAGTTDISATPAALTFRYKIGNTLPVSQTLQVKSTGSNFAITLSITGPAPYSAQWLSVSANAANTPASIKVYVNPTGLPAGSYAGTISVTASAASNSPLSVPVTLEVGDMPATLTAAPLALTFDYTSGQAVPAAKTIVLSSSGGPLSASITVSGGTWLRASPSGNIALVGLPGTVSVTVDPAGLDPGVYTGRITFNSSTAANKTAVVTVTLNVNAGVPTITGVWPAGVGINSPQTVITLTGTSFFSKSTASAGGTALTTTVLSPTTMLATVPAAMLTTAGNLDVTVTTPPPGGGTSAPVHFIVYPAAPQILAVANVASYDTAAISPGGIITIYGVGLGPATMSMFDPQSGSIATTLPATGAATSVTIDGVAAPLLYTGANQLSCIVPYAVGAKAGQNVNVVVVYNSVASSAYSVAVAAVHPGVFTLDASGAGQGAILNYNSTTSDYSINSSANAAAKGSTVVIYVTGFGQTSPAGQEGQLISGAVAPVASVAVSIGGQTAALQGAVAPVGSVPGVLQINATVPTTIKAGNSIPVVVTVGGMDSQAGVTMAVK